MAITVNKVDDNTIEVIAQQSTVYNINDLIAQANQITQGIIDSQNRLSQLNDIISGAQISGITIDQTGLIDQTQALPVKGIALGGGVQ